MESENKKLDIRLSALRDKVQKAFANVEYPGDENLIQDATDWEQQLTANKYRGRDWRSLSNDFFETMDSPFPWFTAEALRFYLPAFLSYILSSQDALRSDAVELTMNAIRPPYSYLGSSEWMHFLRRMDPLSREQQEVIQEVIRFLVEETDVAHDDDFETYVRYWENLSPNL